MEATVIPRTGTVTVDITRANFSANASADFTVMGSTVTGSTAAISTTDSTVAGSMVAGSMVAVIIKCLKIDGSIGKRTSQILERFG